MTKAKRVTTLTLDPRERVGTTGARATRRTGRIPGVLYGHGASLAVAVDARALAELLNAGGQSHIVDATVAGVHDSVLLRDVQRDPISHRPIAADFQRVSQTEAINATVAVVTAGLPRGVKDAGGVMDVVTHALEIRGPAGRLPEAFVVDVSGLGIGGHVLAGDIALPAGFALITPRETVVVSVEPPRTTGEAEGEAAAAPAVEAPAAP